jgi:hypothetical protein
MTEPNPSGRPVAHFFGLVLMVASLLWIAFCGYCAYSLFGDLFASTAYKTTSDFLFVAALTFVPAALGAAVGYALFVVGRNLWQAK